MDFKTIEFGYRSADAERRTNPELLEKGFFELHGSIRNLLQGHDYLVLGYKGSGKSAIAEHLDLIAESDADLFVEISHLSDFPFREVPELVPDDTEATMRASLGWSLVLLIKLFESLSTDEGLTSNLTETRRLARALGELGLLQKHPLRDLVLRGREVSFSATLPKLFSASVSSSYESPTTALTAVRDALLELVCGAKTDARHLLIIDGLDEVFYGFSEVYPLLSSLIHEVDRLNSEFSNRRSVTKILVLVRTDLFERLPSPNVNKLRDFALSLDWHSDPQNPYDSLLSRLATHRARLAGYVGEDVLAEFLPRTMQFGEHETLRFMIDHTRHTPRDFLQLLHHVQRKTSGRRPNERAVKAGVRSYSLDYFLPELKDELAGYFDPDATELFLRLLGGLRKREFYLSDLESFAQEESIDVDIRTGLRVLFDCSAVGNIVRRPRRDGRDGVYFTFRYRNRNASINFREELILHKGAWKALNLV